MGEVWKNIEGFSGYQVSNKGRVRTFRKRKHYPTGYGIYWYISNEPTIMHASDDGNGYMKVMLYGDDGRRYCKKIHRLVADAFIPRPDNMLDPTVDHIISGPEGKLDNSVENLRWLERGDNIRKAYTDGLLEQRIQMAKVPVMLIDYDSYEHETVRTYFPDVKSCADYLGLHYTSVSHALAEHRILRGQYYVEYADFDERLYYGTNDEEFW